MRSMRAVLALSLLVQAVPLSAQSLDRVEELSRLGRTEEARAMLSEWWSASRDGASQRDLQRGLWLRGRLTVDPGMADLDYQRLVVLYPSSPYAPQALLRLAQSAYANGDSASAARHVTTIARDYPTSPTRNEAEAWLRSAGALAPTSGVPRPALSAQTAAAPSATAGQPTTTPQAQPPARGAPAPVPPSAAPRASAPADERLEWAVQFGAFTDEDRAFALQQDLVGVGLAARLVRVAGSRFLHVRIGRFATRAEASTQLEQVSRQGFTAAIVRDDRAEEVVRR